MGYPSHSSEHSQHAASGYRVVNDVIADKNVVTKIMNNSTGLQHIELNGLVKRHWKLVITPLHMVGV